MRYRAVTLALGLAVAGLAAAAQQGTPFPGTLDQHPAIGYWSAAGDDPVARLDAAARRGMRFEPRLGYLRGVLDALDVSVTSQVLLFSKTGVQASFTAPATPRALYFNDRVVVGFIPGAPVVELASHDAREGVRFYTLAQDHVAEPSFERPSRCLSCHLSANSLDVPGLLVRSMFTGADGLTRPQLGSFLVDHRTPLEERWGGWFVTGTTRGARHLGNAMVSDTVGPEAVVTAATLDRDALPDVVDTSYYPRATSDIVSLLLFDHQARAINLMTRLGWEARVAEAEKRDAASGAVPSLARELADYLLFEDEAPLPGPITGAPDVVAAFVGAGVRDSRGRSLRELDLTTRLLKFRCSYMVYAPAFDALPPAARALVVARMQDVLTARKSEALDILRATVRAFAEAR